MWKRTIKDNLETNLPRETCQSGFIF